MIVTCAQCQSRYYVDVDFLHQARPVKCLTCDYTWVQEAYKPSVELTLSHTETAPSYPHSKTFSLLPSLRLWLWGLLMGMTLLGAFFLTQHQNLVEQMWSKIVHLKSTFLESYDISESALQIQNVETEVLMSHPSHKEIRLRGSITNSSSNVTKLPPLKIHFWGSKLSSSTYSAASDSTLLETRIHSLSQSHLLPGETLPFEITVSAHHPHLTATSLTF